MEHRDFVERFVRRYANRGVAREDLRQTGLLALIEAADRYDPGRNTPFLAFASATIDGTIKRHFRDRTWNVRPPRRVQELHLQVRAAEDQLSQSLGRRPTVRELAVHLETTEDFILEAFEARQAHSGVSIDRGPMTEDDAVLEPSWLGGDERGYVQVEARSVLSGAFVRLSEREREILRLRYVERLSQQEIADRMGISQSYLSRVIRKALSTLRHDVGELAS